MPRNHGTCRAHKTGTGVKKKLAARRIISNGQIKKKQAAAAKGGAGSTEHALNAASGGGGAWFACPLFTHGIQHCICVRMSFSTASVCAVATDAEQAAVRSVLDDIMDQVCSEYGGDEVDWSTHAERAAYWKKWEKLQTIIATQHAAAHAFNFISYNVRSMPSEEYVLATQGAYLAWSAATKAMEAGYVKLDPELDIFMCPTCNCSEFRCGCSKGACKMCEGSIPCAPSHFLWWPGSCTCLIPGVHMPSSAREAVAIRRLQIYGDKQSIWSCSEY